MGSRIDTNGQMLDGNGVNISGPNEPGGYATTSVAWDGSQWKVTWGNLTDTRLARVSAAGQVLDPGGVLVAGATTGVSASAGNGSLQLAWSDFVWVGQTGSYEVFSTHIDPSNVAGEMRTLSIGAPAQQRADVATSGSGYMMVYRSATTPLSRVLAQPLDAAGNPLTTEPIELDASTDSINYPGSPAVAWNGSLYMVAWSNSTGVVARRLQPDGTPIDPASFLVMNPGFGPADVASLGSNFLVVGLRCGVNCQYIFPIASRVRGSDGLVLDSPPIEMGGTYGSSPRLAVLGGRWLLAWQANVTHDDSIAYTLGTLIDAAGAKVPDFTIHGPYSTAGGNGIFSLGLASSGSVALMVQSQELTSGVETDLLARLIDPDGTVHPYVNLTPWKDDQYRPRAAWDGSQFVVVWQDQKTDVGGEWSLEQIDARSDLMGMRISAAGAIIDPQGFVFSNSLTGEAYPNVVASGGTTLIAGSIVRNDAVFANYRIGYELFGAGGNNWPVAVASADPTGGDVPLSVDFSSAGSTDPDGTLTAYAWDFGDGATSPEADPTHFYALGGPYVATLTVTDDDGAATMQELLVEAVEPNIPPVAVASSDITSGPVPLDVIFYATGSYDPDGFIGNIEWTFSDGGTTYGSPAFYTFYTRGDPSGHVDGLRRPRRHRNGHPDHHRGRNRSSGCTERSSRHPVHIGLDQHDVGGQLQQRGRVQGRALPGNNRLLRREPLQLRRDRPDRTEHRLLRRHRPSRGHDLQLPGSCVQHDGQLGLLEHLVGHDAPFRTRDLHRRIRVRRYLGVERNGALTRTIHEVSAAAGRSEGAARSAPAAGEAGRRVVVLDAALAGDDVAHRESRGSRLASATRGPCRAAWAAPPGSCRRRG